MIDTTTVQLFHPFQREMGRWRHKVYNLRGFSDWVESHNGVDDIYTSVYYNPNIIDRILFDLDIPSFDDPKFDRIGSAEETRFTKQIKWQRFILEESSKLYTWCRDNGFTVVPLLTGKKGIQLHVLSKPIETDQPKEVLSRVTWFILQKALSVKYNDLTSVDAHLIGNTAALCRVPNTLRPPENTTYCSYLPENFIYLSEEELYHYAKYPHSITYNMKRNKSLLELPMDEIEVVRTPEQTAVFKHKEPKVSSFMNPSDPVEFLKRLLSPHRLEQITQPNPTHKARIVTTLELLDSGLHPEEIINIYSRLGWHDYNERISRGYVYDISRRYYEGSYRVRRRL